MDTKTTSVVKGIATTAIGTTAAASLAIVSYAILSENENISVSTNKQNKIEAINEK